MVKPSVLHLIVYDEYRGHKTSGLYSKFTVLLKYSKMWCVYVVWLMCVVDSHPVIKSNIPRGIILPIKYMRQLHIW